MHIKLDILYSKLHAYSEFKNVPNQKTIVIIASKYFLYKLMKSTDI
jgi:hypothetical protein